MESKPIKRNENIVILSREHHHGLLFAWKLRQGLSAKVEPTRMAKYVAYFWNTHLVEHFREEESLLFSELQHALVSKAVGQHTAINTLVHRILVDEKGSVDAYGNLADLIADHIRFEERELFPYLEAVIPSEQLSHIGSQLASLHRKLVPDDYPDEFWLGKKS